MPTVVIAKCVNEVFCRIECEQFVARELTQKFKFQVPGFQYNPKFKMGFWDGFIYLFSPKTQTIYKGLLHYVEAYCKENDFEFVNETEEHYVPWDEIRLNDWIDTLGIPDKYKSRDYQLDTLLHCINNNRALFVSPTGSGKSLTIYQLARFNENEGPTLIIVPNVGLVNQMTGDFRDYGYDVANIHRIFSGQEKDTKSQIVISTWQSIYKLPKEWFQKFVCVIGDEAHKAKAQHLKSILEKMTKTKYRYGMTGSLDGTQTNQMVLEGLFGAHKKIVSTTELIDQGYLADLEIKVLLLKHNKETSKDVLSANDYHYELAKIVSNESRNNFIADLALKIGGNVLVLYQLVDAHGGILYNLIRHKNTQGIDVHYIHGKIKADVREEIRLEVNDKYSSIIVASMGCFAEGINLPNLDYLILASPTKSRVRVMQMIGRVLRRTDRKNKCVVFDIADDMSNGKKQNFTLRHYKERLRYYAEENFKYSQFRINL